MFSLNYLLKNLTKRSINWCKLMSTSKSLQTINNNYNYIESNNELTTNQSLSFDDFKSLAIDKRIEAKIKIIIYEYELLRRSDAESVPKKLSLNDMKQLLNCYRMRKSKRIWIDMSFKDRQKLFLIMKKIELNKCYNQLEIPIMPSEIQRLFSYKLKTASLFGQNLIIDLSFDDYMSSLECKNCAEQLWRIYHYNRYNGYNYRSKELPFNLNLVNINYNERTHYFMEKLFPELYKNESYVNITSKSYLDLFPKSSLIYLSPHAEEVMTEYDHNKCFIIGGIVDRQKVIQLSDIKAKQENIRSMRLPLDDLMVRHNIQSLDDVIRVLHDLKNKSLRNEDLDWDKTLRLHLPKYKLKSEGQIAYELMQKQGIDSDFEDYSAENSE